LYTYDRQNFSGDRPPFGDPCPPLNPQNGGARTAPAGGGGHDGSIYALHSVASKLCAAKLRQCSYVLDLGQVSLLVSAAAAAAGGGGAGLMSQLKVNEGPTPVGMQCLKLSARGDGGSVGDSRQTIEL